MIIFSRLCSMVRVNAAVGDTIFHSARGFDEKAKSIFSKHWSGTYVKRVTATERAIVISIDERIGRDDEYKEIQALLRKGGVQIMTVEEKPFKDLHFVS